MSWVAHPLIAAGGHGSFGNSAADMMVCVHGPQGAAYIPLNPDARRRIEEEQRIHQLALQMQEQQQLQMQGQLEHQQSSSCGSGSGAASKDCRGASSLLLEQMMAERSKRRLPATAVETSERQRKAICFMSSSTSA
eukprot:GHVT01048848.1.p1 GENE.GHVT01048848.1~~GHVT01048848.1.p1  ORF type:complete len:136 (+),score=35.85 GHVT01048848.1:683-1090(+)